MATVVAPEPPTAPMTLQQRELWPAAGAAFSASTAVATRASSSAVTGDSRTSDRSSLSSARTRLVGRLAPTKSTAGAEGRAAKVSTSSRASSGVAASVSMRIRSSPGSAALIDLNLADGAAAAYLGARANMRLAEASAEPGRIDAAILDAFAVRIDAGFDLLACPRDPLAFTRISPGAICRVLDIACQAYEWVIVDLPRLRQPWTLDVLAGSDEVLVVSELTVPALLSARALAGEIEAEMPETRRPRVILNRMSSRAFGPAPSRVEAEKALQRKVDGAVTSDWEAAACSVNLGGPICQHRPRSKIVKDVAGLVDKLATQPARTSDRASMVA